MKKSISETDFKPVAGSAGSKIQKLYDFWRATGDKKTRAALELMLFEQSKKVAMIEMRIPALQEEATGAALEAVARSLRKYDPAHGARLWTYLVTGIHHALSEVRRRNDAGPAGLPRRTAAALQDLRKIRRNGQSSSPEDEWAGLLKKGHTPFGINGALAHTGRPASVDFDKIAGSYRSPEGEERSSPESMYAHKERRALARAAIAQLPEREARVLDMYYIQELTHDKISSALGVSRERARQVEKKAVRSLRKALKLS